MYVVDADCVVTVFFFRFFPPPLPPSLITSFVRPSLMICTAVVLLVVDWFFGY